MSGPGLWVQEKPRPWSRPSSISNKHCSRDKFSPNGVCSLPF